MTTVLPEGDPRSERARQLAAESARWLKCVVRSSGELVWALPSQRKPDLFHLTDGTVCSCGDFQYNGLSRSRIGRGGAHLACKHLLAIGLVSEGDTARQATARSAVVRRGRPSEGRVWSGEAWHGESPTTATQRLGDRYAAIFKKFEGD